MWEELEFGRIKLFSNDDMTDNLASVSRWMFFLLFSLGASIEVRGEDKYPPEGLFEEIWMEVRMFGAKVGYAHTTFERRGLEIRLQTHTFMKIKRAGSEVVMESHENSRETIDGKILGFGGKVDMGAQPISKEGIVKGNKVVVTKEQFGRKSTNSYELDEKGVMNWGLIRLMVEKGFRVGTKYEVWVYSPDFGMESPTKASIEVHGEETIKLHGGITAVTKVATVLHSHAGQIKTLSWVDECGMALKTTMHLGGFPIEMVKTSSGEAMKDFVSAEFFNKSLIKLEGEIPRDAQSVTYELSPKMEGSLQAVPEDGDFQKAKRQEDGAVQVQVKRIKLSEVFKGKGNPGQVGPEYRLPNIMIDANDPGIRALARAASRGTKNPVQMASNLRSFVTRFVTAKNLDVGFATASEVARTREGDCSEHAVLLAAMGRSSGLPSRVAAGLVYMPRYEGNKNIMGFHMWTQFHIRGKWVDFDAAMGESECAPTRIALATSSLKDESLSSIAFSIAEPIGNLKVRIIAVKR